MITQSGCFGSKNEVWDGQIDTAAEAAAAVDAVVNDANGSADPDPTSVATVQLAVVCETLRQRVRVLTWVVALLALFLVAKEMK